MRLSFEQIYEFFKKAAGICTDTRNITKGAIFLALKGENFNANNFALDALGKGCSYAIIDEEISGKDDRCILVDDVQKALQYLAKIHRTKMEIPFIGITGTNGKTTTKELIHAVLSEKYKVVATKGNLNNHIGVPMTILSVNKNTEIAIIEMGANHPGEIAGLCEIADPALGLITNIGKAHLEGFGSFEGVVETKNELYKYLRNKKGKVFVNSDNPLLKKLSDGMETVNYGTSETDFLVSRVVKGNPFLEMETMINNQWEHVKTNLVGAYNFENVEAAICIGKYFGVENDRIIRAIGEYHPSNNRSQIIHSGKNTIIMDAYNANPTSMNAALLNFIESNVPEKALILGDMRELGNAETEEHQKILDLLDLNSFKFVILVGPIFKSLSGNNHLCFETSENAAEWLKQNPVTGKNILIKGSRGIKLEKLLEQL
jgi:UDP-N-acetylmuramoyl-tripeptide--D-alanyl-D-alanine ligase